LQNSELVPQGEDLKLKSSTTARHGQQGFDDGEQDIVHRGEYSRT
jgi:hypothetical protein